MKKKLVIGYCSVLVLLILFPPWDSVTPGLDFMGYNFIVPFIKTKYVWYAYAVWMCACGMHMYVYV